MTASSASRPFHGALPACAPGSEPEAGKRFESDARRHHRRKAHGADAEHGDRRSRADAQRIEHRAGACLKAAAERPQQFQRRVLAHFYCVALVGEGVGAEGGLAEEVAGDGQHLHSHKRVRHQPRNFRRRHRSVGQQLAEILRMPEQEKQNKSTRHVGHISHPDPFVPRWKDV